MCKSLTRKISWEVAAKVERKYKIYGIKGKVFPVHVMKNYGEGEAEVRFQLFSTSALDGSE